MKELCILLLVFFIYSFVGWICEVIYTLFLDKKLVNRGFLIGPVVPIYGIGGILIMLLLTRYKDDPFVLYCVSIVIAAILEYTTSYLMEKIFKNRWWDYSHFKFNINGRICLETMLPFGVLAMIMIYGVNPILLKFLNTFSLTLLKILAGTLSLVMIFDIIVSFNIIISLKNISNQIKSDSTELITKKVKEIIMKKTYGYTRLLRSFPNMQMKNTLSILKDKLRRDKNKIKKEEEKVKEDKEKIKEETNKITETNKQNKKQDK